jgi:hypothetical protein
VLVFRLPLLEFQPEVTAGYLLIAFLASIAILILAVAVGSLARISTTRGAVILGILGTLLIAGPIVYNKVFEPIILARNRPVWVTQNDGKLQVTVTGIPNFDYDRLKEFETADVLQMANPEVTDETLKKLANFKMLKELDLSDTQVDDAGLEILKNCASLEKIRLANTKITDDGFRKHIMPRDWILEIDVSGTEVQGKTLRRWKAEKDNRKYVGG